MIRTTSLTSIALALTLSLTLAACSSDSSSSTATSEETVSSESTTEAAVSIFGPVSDFDYVNFTYDQGLTTGGLWDGITATDYVTLPEDFATITVPTAEVTPADSSIQAQIDEVLSYYVTSESITDRAAENGDTVTIDYSGSIGGVAFTGGTATGAELTLGSGGFIDGFEDAIVGHEVGESFDIVVTFPEGYPDSTDADGNTIVLSGAEATFAINLTAISASVTPELTDDWVYENLYAATGYATASDVTQAITEELFLQNINIYIWNYLAENAVIESIPAVITEYNVCQCLYFYETYVSGYDLETLATELMGLESADALLIARQDEVLMYAEYMLIQQAVAETLEIAVTDEVMAGYETYLTSNPEGYVAYYALANLIDETLLAGVIMS